MRGFIRDDFVVHSMSSGAFWISDPFHRQHVSADRRRLRRLCGTLTVLGILEAA